MAAAAAKAQVGEKKLPHGRTEDGTEFLVPVTHDCWHDIKAGKLNLIEKFAAGLCILQIALVAFGILNKYAIVVIFFCWRAAYNGGLGWLLHQQSNHRTVERLLGQKFLVEGSPFRDWMKVQLSIKMGPEYDFEKVPMVYNVWLLFRGLVDIILWNDFVTYFVVVAAFTEVPAVITAWDVFLYIVAVVLIVLNWFWKMDALRVIKDFAWYWGDFFFLVDSELTFDGVFQMAPHPMYSIGYIGYYGLSLLSRSYTVLYVSLAAHICQFVFLAVVENPHIEKTYNTVCDQNERTQTRTALYSGPQAVFRRDLIIIKNVDLFRASDVLTLVILGQTIIGYFLGLPSWIYVAQCLAWRFFHSFALGYILHRQSSDKWFTKHFIKYGHSSKDAFSSWKTIYNLSLTMTHTTFLICALKMFECPDSLFSGGTLFKITCGVALTALHMWASHEVFEVVDEYGWFYGDFFVEKEGMRPDYNGIYRFLNNPEKVLGHASFYGIALVSDSWTMWALAVISQVCTMLFLHYVEGPHMRKLYGDEVRSEAGLTSAVKHKLRPFRLFQEGHTFLDQQTAKLSESLDKTKSTINSTGASISRKVDALRAPVTELVDPVAAAFTRRFGLLPKVVGKVTLSVQATAPIGEPLRVRWTSSVKPRSEDWIGIYPVGRNPSKTASSRSSQGRWVRVVAEQADKDGLYHGEVVFQGGQLPWRAGLYEARMHYKNNHGVLAISDPFEIEHTHLFPMIPESEDIGETDISIYLTELYSRILGDRAEVQPDAFLAPLLSKFEKMAVCDYVESALSVEIDLLVVDAYPTIGLLTDCLMQARASITGRPQEKSPGATPSSSPDKTKLRADVLELSSSASAAESPEVKKER